MTRPAVGEQVLIRVFWDHDWDRGDYHQWVTLGQRVKANRHGYSNPRMYDAQWTKWICNGDCAAWALVHDSFIETALLDMDALGQDFLV